MAELLLSPSSISLYRKCPRAFYYHKILNVPPMQLKVEALDFGRLVHKVIEHYYQIVPDSLSPMEVDMWVVKACKDVNEALSDKLIQHMRNFIKFERKRLEWHINPRPIAIEKEYVKPPFHGIIDAVFRKGKDIVIVDWKTGYGRAPRLTEDLLIQGAVYKYLVGAREMYFVFLRYGDVIRHPESYTIEDVMPLVEEIMEAVKRGPDAFPFREGPHCESCEYSLYCWAERRRYTVWCL